MAHMAFVRSTVAHANVRSVDVTDALQMPGVAAAYQSDDLGLPPLSRRHPHRYAVHCRACLARHPRRHRVTPPEAGLATR